MALKQEENTRVFVHITLYYSPDLIYTLRSLLTLSLHKYISYIQRYCLGEAFGQGGGG